MNEIREGSALYLISEVMLERVVETAVSRAITAMEVRVGGMEKQSGSGEGLLEGLMGIEGVMELLGVSKTTLWKWEKRGYLSPVRVGKRLYYRRVDVEGLLGKDRVKWNQGK
jgi:predicted DNA-binding transcriptional regulator AlpA